MEDSILRSIKKLIGIENDDPDFNLDLITHINSLFLTLRQIGIEADKVFAITGENEQWSDFIADESKLEVLNTVKSYMFLKTKLIFDPPTGVSHVEALNKIADEMEWRLALSAEKA